MNFQIQLGVRAVLEVQENNIFTINFFENINSYKSQLAISQLIKFFEKYNVVIPKTTIQNFVRNEVLSEVVEKRYYEKLHILQTVIALMYKDIFSLSDISALNKLITSECEKTSVDDVFKAIYSLHNSMDDYKETNSYLDIVFLMTNTVMNKNEALELLQASKKI